MCKCTCNVIKTAKANCGVLKLNVLKLWYPNALMLKT